MFLYQRPIEPGNGVVLTVSVVVSALSSTALVAEQHHRHALTEHERGEHIFDLSCAKSLNRCSASGAFHAVVAAKVVDFAVAVAFAVGFVVFFVVADQVVKGKTVVRGNEIDTVIWP